MQSHLPVRLLLVDDDEDDYVITRNLLAECEGSPFQLDWVTTCEAALAAIREARHDVYLVDYRLGNHHGLELLHQAVAQGCSAPIIMLTGQGDRAIDMEAMKAGAADFLVKGQLSASLLERAIRYAIERAHTVDVLKQSEERYRLLFESNPQSMWVYDRASLAILTVNQAAMTHYGYSRSEFLAMTINDLHLPEQRAAVLEVVYQATGSFPQPCVWKHLKKNGTLIDVEITRYDLLFDGRSAGLVLANDITERLNLEAQLRQSQKMESVGQLAAGVAHDFNNILTVITGQTCLLLADQDLTPVMAEALTQVRVAADRAANLTRQLLTFSRKQIMQLRTLDLNEVIRNVAQMLHRLLGENIDLEFVLAPHLPPIQADIGMVEQIIVNLSVNSRDAMPNGGRLIIGTSVEIAGTACLAKHPEIKAGYFACLSVTDTGCGMDAHTLSRIFEPFFTTKEVGKGTGLGLATVYGIIKQHQGWVEVESQVNQGTTFRAYLPAAAPSVETSKKEGKAVSVAGGSERILVAEDEPSLRLLVRRILERRGYQVLTAATGTEALRLAQQQGPIDLLLTDMVMPKGMSGRELGKRLQVENPQLKVIYTSGYSMDLVGRDFALQEGCNFLQKPYQPDKLARAVRHCLDTGKLNFQPEYSL